MIEIGGKSVTVSVKIIDKNFWHRLSDGWSNDVKRTGDSWYHLTLTRHKVEYSVKDEFTAEDHAQLMALEADYYHFHWYDEVGYNRKGKAFAKKWGQA